MPDFSKKLPTLTLEPEASHTSQDIDVPSSDVIVLPEDENAQTVPVTEMKLTEEEQALVDDFASKIELRNSNQILQYGSGAQKKIAGFSENVLAGVRSQDLNEIGDMLTGVVTELKGFDAEEEKGLFGVFKRSGNKLATMRVRYDKAEINIMRICETLEKHQMQLLKDVALLDQLYELNSAYFKELCLYLIAGKKKLVQVQNEEVTALSQRAKQSGLPQDAQAANDLSALCNRFDKKLHDLELTRMISIQMAPQIRLIQNNNIEMSDKIQSTLVNTIPLWKSQMVLALGVEHSRKAAAAQRQVTDMTNELLRKNAETLKMATIETAKESERGVVDMQTLRDTNQSLITTLDEVLRIQTQGKQKRREAEIELARLEGELKQKLLSV